MELTDAGKRVIGDFPENVNLQYRSGPIFSPAGGDDLPKYVSLALFRTETWEYEAQRGTMIDTPAIVASQFGKGRVLAFSAHPEMSDGLESLVKRAVLSTARKPVHGD
jgi:hypothetical protein